MKKIIIHIFFTFFLFAFTIPQKTYSTERIKTIVVFFSLDVNLPAYNYFLEGLNEKFSEIRENPFNVMVEYMNVTGYPDEENIKNIVGLYNEKYKTVGIDLLITFGPGTYLMLKKHGFEPIQDSPIINIDIESNILANGDDPFFADEELLQIRIKTDYVQTLKTAFELFPDYQDVYIISGSSPADVYFARLTQQAAQTFKKTHDFLFWSGNTLDSTLARVRNIPQNSIVFVTSFIEDIKGIPYSTSMVVRIISTLCPAPVFTLSDDFINEGAMGGYVYSFIELGKHTGKIAEEVLNGKPIKEITVDEFSFSKYMYNWQLLKKWDLLDSKAVPSESEFFKKEESFFVEYKWYLLFALLFLISQTFLIMYLFKLNKKQKGVAKQRTENERLYRELVREDRLSRMSELTASLSHELNQPLTAILYNAQAGKRFLETGKLDDRQAAEIFENIIEDDKRAGSLISSVRSLMKLENREKEKVNLNRLIRETEKLFHSETIAQQIHISLHLQDDPAFVFGDKIQIQQVLLNLLFNATTAMENNSPENKKIQIIQQSDGKYVTVSIRDSGVGIEDSLKENIFSPFVTSGVKSLGIGLAVSKSIIEKHDGVIQAENLPSGGAEFSFTLHVLDDETQ